MNMQSEKSDAGRDNAITAAYVAIYGPETDPFQHPEGWDYAATIVDAVLAALIAPSAGVRDAGRGSRWRMVLNLATATAKSRDDLRTALSLIEAEARKALTARPDGETVAIPAGMKPWHGGRKPNDWSGEAVQFRSGEVRCAEAGVVWKLGWDHSYGNGDIIAYTPSPTTNAGGERDDGWETNWEVWEGDMLVASADSEKEARHYLAVYSQDGPVRLVKAETRRTEVVAAPDAEGR